MKKMLIDATHAEELRVAIIDGNKLDDFETETAGKAQLKGNIYIGHVSRVEPSLQAAFITYGGNRNGFLAFGEVHPQFFALPKAEKADLLNELAEQAARRRRIEGDEPDEAEATAGDDLPLHNADVAPDAPLPEEESKPNAKPATNRKRPKKLEAKVEAESQEQPASTPNEKAPVPQPERKRQAPIHRRYRIQDVLKEGQKILVQVVKEERGSKGAALTTYFSLPGRYTVLMPNTPYAGGISRKVSDPEERHHLRETFRHLKVPETMGLIIRTAGVGQPVDAIRKDYDNLLNLWQSINKGFDDNDDIQCIHEDGSVIIRALRDMMTDDIDEVIVSGARAYKLAKDYAKNLMPDALKLIKQHKDDSPLFTQYKVEQKLNQLHFNRVTLPSGGYLIINPTEALVAVDINSGRATQERNIEETALKTNLEACDELARQIRLRDLAGLIVVDFIDMEDGRNVRKVENAMRKALKRDRARIQYDHISDFGLMEISRQRLRPSFGESHFIACPHCLGTGLVHSPSTAGLMILRRLEEDDVRGADRVTITTSTEQVLWLLNHKRDLIRELENKAKFQILFRADDTLVAPDHKLELTTFKADGTESTQTIAVTLREQPELPPEERQRGRNRPERSERPERGERGDRNDRPERGERDDRRRNDRDDRSERRDRKEKPESDQSESRPEGQGGKRGRGPNRPGNDDRQPRRPTRIGGDTPLATDEPETQAQKPEPRGKKPPKQVEKQPKTDKPENKRPPQPKVEAEDKPLLIEKVTVAPEAETPLIKKGPARKVEVRKQADTDEADAPLQVAKVTTEGTTQEELKPAKSGKKAGGFLSRLIG